MTIVPGPPWPPSPIEERGLSESETIFGGRFACRRSSSENAGAISDTAVMLEPRPPPNVTAVAGGSPEHSAVRRADRS